MSSNKELSQLHNEILHDIKLDNIFKYSDINI